MANLSSIQLGKLTRLSLNEFIHRSISTTSPKVSVSARFQLVFHCVIVSGIFLQNHFLNEKWKTAAKTCSIINQQQQHQ